MPTVFDRYMDLFDALVGTTVRRVTFSHVQPAVWFDTALLRLSGRWALRDGAGAEVDRDAEYTQRTGFRLWELVGATVVGFQFFDQAGHATILKAVHDYSSPHLSPDPHIIADQTFTLETSHGYALAVFADETNWEDWSLETLDRTSYLVWNNGGV